MRAYYNRTLPGPVLKFGDQPFVRSGTALIVKDTTVQRVCFLAVAMWGGQVPLPSPLLLSLTLYSEATHPPSSPPWHHAHYITTCTMPPAHHYTTLMLLTPVTFLRFKNFLTYLQHYWKKNQNKTNCWSIDNHTLTKKIQKYEL